jgi:hypothetical protein
MKILSMAEQARTAQVFGIEAPTRRLEMDKILMILRQLVSRLLERDCIETDPLARMSPLELADLPPVHPDRDECVC